MWNETNEGKNDTSEKSPQHQGLISHTVLSLNSSVRSSAWVKHGNTSSKLSSTIQNLSTYVYSGV